MAEDRERPVEEAVGDDRRAFMRKMIVGTAFTVPVVSSFTMSGVQAAFAQTPPVSAPRRGPAAEEPTTTSSGTTTSTSTTTTTTQPNSTNGTLNPDAAPG